MKNKGLAIVGLMFGVSYLPAQAAEYRIDPAHSFVEFRISHLGYSWVYGRFNDISGSYSYDADNPEASRISVQIDPASIDTKNANRDKEVRGERFLHVGEHPSASFESTGYDGTAEEGVLEGNLTLLGVTKPIRIDVKKVGEGDDPWGGYRSGFIGTTTLNRKDFGVDGNLGPASWTMDFELAIEGVRQ